MTHSYFAYVSSVDLNSGGEVLRVTAEGEFIWNENADDMIASGDYSHYPALRHILKALRENERLREAVAAEREACAKVAESYEPRCESCPSGVSNAIRARGET